MLPVLLLRLETRRAARATLTAILHQTPRQLLFTALVVCGVLIDFAIPLLALGCLSWGHCPILHP